MELNLHTKQQVLENSRKWQRKSLFIFIYIRIGKNVEVWNFGVIECS